MKAISLRSQLVHIIVGLILLSAAASGVSAASYDIITDVAVEPFANFAVIDFTATGLVGVGVKNLALAITDADRNPQPPAGLSVSVLPAYLPVEQLQPNTEYSVVITFIRKSVFGDATYTATSNFSTLEGTSVQDFSGKAAVTVASAGVAVASFDQSLSVLGKTVSDFVFEAWGPSSNQALRVDSTVLTGSQWLYGLDPNATYAYVVSFAYTIGESTILYQTRGTFTTWAKGLVDITRLAPPPVVGASYATFFVPPSLLGLKVDDQIVIVRQAGPQGSKVAEIKNLKEHVLKQFIEVTGLKPGNKFFWNLSFDQKTTGNLYLTYITKGYFATPAVKSTKDISKNVRATVDASGLAATLSFGSSLVGKPVSSLLAAAVSTSAAVTVATQPAGAPLPKSVTISGLDPSTEFRFFVEYNVTSGGSVANSFARGKFSTPAVVPQDYSKAVGVTSTATSFTIAVTDSASGVPLPTLASFASLLLKPSTSSKAAKYTEVNVYLGEQITSSKVKPNTKYDYSLTWQLPDDPALYIVRGKFTTPKA